MLNERWKTRYCRFGHLNRIFTIFIDILLVVSKIVDFDSGMFLEFGSILLINTERHKIDNKLILLIDDPIKKTI